MPLRSPDAHAPSRPPIAPSLWATHLHVVTVGDRNVVALTGADGVVLVDGGPPEQASGLLETIANLPDGGDVHTLFNTCWHPEQTA